MDSEIINQVKSLKEIPELKNYRIGVAGSYARGEETKDSDYTVDYT